MNIKIRELLVKVVNKSKSNEVTWEHGDFYQAKLKNGMRVCVSSVPLTIGAPQLRYIIETESGTITGKVNPWEEEEGYEVWLAVYNAAKESVSTHGMFPAVSIAESLRDIKEWTDCDGVEYDFMVMLGLIDPVVSPFGSKSKHVFWSANDVGTAVHEMIETLVKLGMLERRDDPDLQYRWNQCYHGTWE